jgi:hypothetical protein
MLTGAVNLYKGEVSGVGRKYGNQIQQAVFNAPKDEKKRLLPNLSGRNLSTNGFEASHRPQKFSRRVAECLFAFPGVRVWLRLLAKSQWAK